MTPATHALGIVVSDRITSLIQFRRWYRRLLLPSLKPAYSSMYAEWGAELKVLLPLARRARKIARAAEVARSQAEDVMVERYIERNGGREMFEAQVEFGMRS